MNLSYIPDAAAMTLLFCVLLFVRKRHSTLNIGSWLVALVFVILATTAGILAAPQGKLHFLWHFCQLFFESLTALAFIYGAEDPSFTQQPRDQYLLWSAPAQVALVTLYGWNVIALWPYAIVVAFGIVTTLFSAIKLRNRWLVAAFQLLIWVDAASHLYDGATRNATYEVLGGLYLLAAYIILRKLPDRSIGKITMVVGLVVWAISFLLHPWSILHPTYRLLADQVRYIQKFLVSTGLLLLLLEDQVANNERLALHDQLTGLPNRRLLEDRLPHAIATSRRTKVPLTLFLFDLNGFKRVNDKLGHRAGDRLLAHVATTLRATLRDTDTLARLGGDEFVLLAPGMGNRDDIERFENSLQSRIQTPLVIDGHTISVTSSIGFAIYPEDADGATTQQCADHLLDLADARMYALKLAMRQKGANPDPVDDLSGRIG